MNTFSKFWNFHRYKDLLFYGVILCIVPLWLLQLNLGLKSVVHQGISWRSHTVDFRHYYLSAHRALNHNSSPYRQPFRSEEKMRFDMELVGIEAPTNPPLLILLTSPLALMSPSGAWISWFFFTLVSAL